MTEKKSLEEKGFWDDAEPIHTYSRKQAIEDGYLVAVDTDLSRQAGLKWLVAICREVWEKYVDWTEEDNKRQTYQNLNGRLWDVLSMLRFAILRAKHDGNGLWFSLNVVPRKATSKAKRARLTRLWASFHAGDEGEPVITILEHERDE